MRSWNPGTWLVVPLAVLTACSSTPLPPAAPPELLPANAFDAVAIDTSPGQALALSPAMQRFVRDEIGPLAKIHGPRAAMFHALFRGHRLVLQYDASRTRSAAEAFDARAGNCLSLTLMTGALANTLGLNVSYQEVDSGSTWNRSGDYLAYSGHVNLVLDGGHLRGIGARYEQRVVVDFLASDDAATHRARTISEATVVGMFLNNRAVEALAAGRDAEAYAWVRSALTQAPRLVPAWNTLALLHRRRGDDGLAIRALAQAAQAAPDNTRVLANLVGALDAAGRRAEAATWRSRLLALEPVAPFQWFERGRQAMAAGRWAEAAEAFARELARDPDQHEVHYWAALAASERGDREGTRRHLARAAEAGPSPQQRGLYAAKLERLNAAGAGSR